jgi:hypothetical protein
MYIIFLGLTPLALSAGRKFGWRVVLGAGFTFWLLAQFGLRQVSWQFLSHHFGLQIPLNEMGAFDLWAWQFLWLLGIWVGVRWAKDDLPLSEFARKLTLPALLVVPVLLAMRYATGRGIELGSFEICFNKWHLGAVRLINFAVLAALLIRAHNYLKPLAVRPLVLLGQSSLQVFCTHLLFCFAGLTLLGNASMLSGWKQVGLIVATLSGMLLTAKLFAKSESNAENKSRPRAQVIPISGTFEQPMPEPVRASGSRWR